MWQNKSLSIYIHWPFCKKKCPYCDFNSHEAKQGVDADRWLAAFLARLEANKDILLNKYISSIYFGGGTPSLMPPKIAAGIIEAVANIAILDSETEITLEANPTSVESKSFYIFKSCGFNRISLGVQSFDDDRLKFLGRNHNAKDAKDALDIAKNCFSNVSIDLIYATYKQKYWEEELTYAMDENLKHISLYQLTIEPNTVFHRLYKNGKLNVMGGREMSKLYKYTNHILDTYGYKTYEISNYSKAGYESRHNLSYWQYNEYLGLGPGAHSRIYTKGNILAKEEIKNPDLGLSTNGKTTETILSKEEIFNEMIMMGMRSKTGVDLDKLYKLSGYKINPKKLEQYIDFIKIDGSIISLKEEHFIICDYIVKEFML